VAFYVEDVHQKPAFGIQPWIEWPPPRMNEAFPPQDLRECFVFVGVLVLAILPEDVGHDLHRRRVFRRQIGAHHSRGEEGLFAGPVFKARPEAGP
jgi:hypothetical protein